MPYGPLMLDIAGLALAAEDRQVLADPAVGGLILFSRNFASCAQLRELVAEVRALRPELIVAVDQEGGRVQRFREGFTRLPPMAALGRLYAQDQNRALDLARRAGWLMAAELIAHDLDLSFAPVLDLGRGISRAIGDRAFAAEARTVIALAAQLIDGMHAAGMAATGKHFPGHGGVDADSHHEVPRDPRPLAQIETEDLVPFASLCNRLDAMMPAHVVFPEVDPVPTGFSLIWLQQILRQRLGFKGVIFSDDLSMAGAGFAGGYAQRAAAALAAGCDMILVCNNRDGVLQVLEFLHRQGYQEAERIAALRHRGQVYASDQLTAAAFGLADHPDWAQTVADLQALS